MNNGKRQTWAAVLGLLWVVIVLGAYYVFHKPFLPTEVVAVMRVLLDVVGVALLLTVAVGVGRVLFSFVGMSPLHVTERLAVEALIGLGRCHEARGTFDRAIGRYRQALGVNELREDVHRRIIRAYADAGRRSDAVAQYRRCRATLREEVGVEPSTETKRLYEEITGKMAG